MIDVKRTVLAKTEYPPYAVRESMLDGKRVYLSMPGGLGEAILCVPGQEPRPLWDDSGTMSIVPDPDRDDCRRLFVTRGFYPGTNAPGTYIDCAQMQDDGSWKMTQVLKKPFIHRHDVVRVGNTRSIIFCNLAEWKNNKEDWSEPGGIYVARLREDNTADEITCIQKGIFKNHGFHRTVWNGCEAVIITGQEGAFVVSFDNEDPTKWSVEHIIDGEISEMCDFDIDGDGEKELAIIEIFHGSVFSVLKKINGKYQKVYSHSGLERCHALWGGVFDGERVFIAGNMAGTKQLLAFSCKTGENPFDMFVQELDAGGGPSNFSVFREGTKDCILSANWAAHEVVLYETKG